MSWGWPHCWKPVANSVKLKAATCVDIDRYTDRRHEMVTIVGSRPAKHVELGGALESAMALALGLPSRIRPPLIEGRFTN